MTDDRSKTLISKLVFANMMLVGAQRIMPAGMGITIIVHAPSLGPADMEKAVASTLTDRQQARILYADCLAEAMLADGLDPERDDFGEIAAGDVARAYGKDPNGGSA